jgi:hypothetical protein
MSFAINPNLCRGGLIEIVPARALDICKPAPTNGFDCLRLTGHDIIGFSGTQNLGKGSFQL